MPQYIDTDPLTGTHHFVEYDDIDDVLRFHQVQNVDGLLDWNQKLASEAPRRFGDLVHVGSIPMPLYVLLDSLGILRDRTALAKWLNDPDHRKYRTGGGHI